MQIAAKEFLSSAELKSGWATCTGILVKLSSVSEGSRNLARQALMLKILAHSHSQFKEFINNTMTLETTEEGKTTDVDVASTGVSN